MTYRWVIYFRLPDLPSVSFEASRPADSVIARAGCDTRFLLTENGGMIALDAIAYVTCEKLS